MKALVFSLMLVASSSVFAQSKIVSIDAFDLSYVGGLAFRHDDGKNSDRDETDFRLKLNYAQNWEAYQGVMWKAQVNFDRLNRDFGSADELQSSYGIAGGFLYNFAADDIKNSIMAGALVGIERATYDYANVKEKSGFNLFTTLEAGKRWDLGSYSAANISYAPTVSLTLKRYGGGIRDDYFKRGHEIRLNFLKFDILF